MKHGKRKLSWLLLLAIFAGLVLQSGLTPTAGYRTSAYAEDSSVPAEDSSYTLDKLVVLSRHGIRSPTAGDSLLEEITPHTWFDWTSGPGELSLRGARQETFMGQYFRLWLEDEGLIPENWQPEEGELRFYSNAKQRTIATSRYFSAGLLPVSVVPIETHADYGSMDDTFDYRLRYLSDAYKEAALEEINLVDWQENLEDAVFLVAEVADIEESEAYLSGKYGDLANDEWTVNLDDYCSISGPISIASTVADALVMQYYEEPDPRKAAFGHELTEEDWDAIGSVADAYLEVIDSSRLISVNIAYPLLQELESELKDEGRVFSFLSGHDSNIVSTLVSLAAEFYELPDSVSSCAPIGAKLCFERYLDADGAAWYAVNLVYQSTEQLRQEIPLSLENPPVKTAVHFREMETNDDGLIAEEDLLNRFREAMEDFETLPELFGAEEAASGSAEEA